MFTKIMLIKKDINNIFNILNKIIMDIFLLFIDIEFVIQFAKLQKYFKINRGNKVKIFRKGHARSENLSLGTF